MIEEFDFPRQVHINSKFFGTLYLNWHRLIEKSPHCFPAWAAMTCVHATYLSATCRALRSAAVYTIVADLGKLMSEIKITQTQTEIATEMLMSAVQNTMYTLQV